MRLTGKIMQDGSTIETQDGRQFPLPTRGASVNGYPQVLIDAQRVGGESSFKRQTVESWIGHDVEFLCLNGETGFNYEIMPAAKQNEPDK